MSVFTNLKKNRKENKKKLMEDLEKVNKGGSSKGTLQDERFWKLTRDKTDKGSAVIRFLPSPDGKNFVKLFSYHFKTPMGKWYIEKSPTTFGGADPVYEANGEAYATKTEQGKKLAESRKRKQDFISNILVIKDPANPENEGKVFLFKYPKGIWNMINAQMFPEFDGMESVDVFDLWEGANFNIRARKGDNKIITYDMSRFDSPTPLFDGDEDALKDLCESLHEVGKEVDPSTFKSYDELKKRFDMVTGGNTGLPNGFDDDEDDDTDSYDTSDNTNLDTRKGFADEVDEMENDEDGDEDDALERFRRLAKE